MWNVLVWVVSWAKPRLRETCEYASFEEAFVEFQSRAIAIDTKMCEFYEFVELVVHTEEYPKIVIEYRDSSIHLYDAQYARSVVSLYNTLVSTEKDVDVELEVSTDDDSLNPADFDGVDKLFLWSHNDALVLKALLHRASIDKQMLFCETRSRYLRCQFPLVCSVSSAEYCVVIEDDDRVRACLYV
jgi:hypothetical protein